MFTGKIKSGADFKLVTAPWLKDKTSKHTSSGSWRPSPRTSCEIVVGFTLGRTLGSYFQEQPVGMPFGSLNDCVSGKIFSLIYARICDFDIKYNI